MQAIDLRRWMALLFLALSVCVSTCAASVVAGPRVVVRALGDVGRQINAADERLGTACGTIVVNPGQTAMVQTPVHLSPCHNLELNAKLSWSEHLLLSKNNKVSAQGQQALQTMLFTGPWATADGAVRLELAGVWALWKTVRGQDDGNRLLLCRACSDLIVHNTHSTGGGYLKTDSTASTYAEVNAGNSSYRIHADHNFVDGRTGPTGGVQAAWYGYTWDVEDTDETIQNTGLAISWWGGNNNKDWTSYSPATLKAGRMHFSRGSANNVVAGWWGCMGQHIRVDHMTVDGCQDVCLDSEGDLDVRFTNFVTSGAINGEISSFFHSQQIVFSDGSVRHTLGAVGSGFFNNNSTNDLTYSRDVTLERIAFSCVGDGVICTIVLDPIASFTLRDSHLVNTRIMNSKFAREQGDEFILSNVFTADTKSAQPWSVLDLSTLGFGRSVICANHFFAERPQPLGSSAILAENPYNNGHPGKILLAANETRGWSNSVSLSASGNTTHFPAHVVLKNNRFDAGISIKQDGNLILDSAKSALESTLPPACLATN
jgi:hypothetical protein